MPIIVTVILIGLLGGIAVGIQGPLASIIGRHTGAIESAFIVHLGGAIGAGLILLFNANKMERWPRVPTYALFAGLLGIVVVAALNYAIPRIGTAGTVTLIVVGQLAVSVVLDHFGWLGASPRPVDLWRIVGLTLLVVGVLLIVRQPTP